MQGFKVQGSKVQSYVYLNLESMLLQRLVMTSPSKIGSHTNPADTDSSHPTAQDHYRWPVHSHMPATCQQTCQQHASNMPATCQQHAGGNLLSLTLRETLALIFVLLATWHMYVPISSSEALSILNLHDNMVTINDNSSF